jgi:hypothetical protein
LSFNIFLVFFGDVMIIKAWCFILNLGIFGIWCDWSRCYDWVIWFANIFLWMSLATSQMMEVVGVVGLVGR